MDMPPGGPNPEQREQNSNMALRDKLEDDIKESMRNRDQARLDALRFLKFAVQAVEKEQKKELDDDAMMEVATKQASDRRDSIRAFEEGGRDTMAARRCDGPLTPARLIPRSHAEHPSS